MSWCKRSRFFYDSFRKLLPKSPIQSPNTRINSISNSNTNSLSSFHDQSKFSGVFGTPSISSKLRNFNGVKQNNQISLISRVYRRNYYVDKNQVYHFKPRGFKSWFNNPKHIVIVVVIGSGVVITLYFGNSEIVPYTKRKHLVLLTRNAERQLGETHFDQLKKECKGKILPAIHPDSVRIRLISKDIIEALQRGISHERVWSDPGYAAEGGNLDGGSHETMKALSEEAVEKVPGDWRKEEEIIDDKWIKESREKGEKHGAKATTNHLEGMNWEILVVNVPIVNAFCLPGGKIVVYTGLLKHFKSDAELATIIGHEVGHAVARHTAEKITKNLWFTILQLVLYQFITPDFVNTMSNLLLRLPFSRKMEIEADYIGLLLMASAGYDPRIAPQVYEKLGKISGETSLKDYFATHPSGKKRAQLLARAHIMEEAVNIYRERVAGRAIEGFL